MARRGRTLTRILVLSILLVLLLVLGGCAPEEPIPDFSGTDFTNSPYKHITNGGMGGEDSMPYAVDAITGATMTVEGPAVETSIPLSIRELENRNDGLFKSVYKDATGSFIYEGMRLDYLLAHMKKGDNGILLTEKAYGVELKDCNRVTIARFSIEEIDKAGADGRPILLAYGMGTRDESTIAPFVYDAENPSEHSEGYVSQLENDDGCLKLVYDLGSYGDNDRYKTFSNVAYVYVKEEVEPGFKHAGTEGVYGSSRYADAILSFRGEGLGAEMLFTLRQLEGLVSYDNQGNLVEGGIGYRDEYGLANNAYWYVNQYEGLDLYKLLLYLGMKGADELTLSEARRTLVSFVADDGVLSKESFSVDTLSYPDGFGFYNKNAADLGDGTYVPVNTDLVDTGYPVLLAYGVNRYPYTITKTDEGYLSGLSNSGGPMRVVFGKTQYNHANGSHQVQYLKDVIVGKDVFYNTHRYTTDENQNALSANKLSVTVVGEDKKTLLSREMTVGEIEEILYGEGVTTRVRKDASGKDSYQVQREDDTYQTDIYEGVNLPYLLMEFLGLPGTSGSAIFSNGSEEITVNLDRLLQTGYNTELKRDKLPAILAFSKNGTPMVASANSPGYVKERTLHPLLSSEPAVYGVDNHGGPLAVILPSTDRETPDGLSLSNVTSIRIELVPDAYAHSKAPYDALSGEKIRFYGEGLEQEQFYTVAQIEGKQKQAQTLDYSMMDTSGTLVEKRYRGVPLYELFTEIGIKSNAGDVIVRGADGTTQTYSLARLKKQTYQNQLSPQKAPLSVLLAFGTGGVGEDTLAGTPLVSQRGQAGFIESPSNEGGPVMLLMPQEHKEEANLPLSVSNVVSIEVTANQIDTWSHRMSDIYGEFLDTPFTFTIRNEDSEWNRIFTVGELESMTDLIVRDRYSVLDIGESEGLSLWKFIQRFGETVPGVSDPVAVTVYADDGYKNDLLSVFYKDGFELGVPNEDGERKQLILAYAVNGYPLVDSENHEGYTGLAGNTAGPLRVVAEGNQGASVKFANKLVVSIPGKGPIVNPAGEIPVVLP